MPDPASFVSITRLVDTRRSIESRKNIESAIYQISRYVHWRASSSNFPVACTNGNDEERKRFVENFSPNAKRRLSWLITCTSPPFVFARIVHNLRVYDVRLARYSLTTPLSSYFWLTENGLTVFHLRYSRGWSIHPWLVVDAETGEGVNPRTPDHPYLGRCI